MLTLCLFPCCKVLPCVNSSSNSFNSLVSALVTSGIKLYILIMELIPSAVKFGVKQCESMSQDIVVYCKEFYLVMNLKLQVLARCKFMLGRVWDSTPDGILEVCPCWCEVPTDFPTFADTGDARQYFYRFLWILWFMMAKPAWKITRFTCV